VHGIEKTAADRECEVPAANYEHLSEGFDLSASFRDSHSDSLGKLVDKKGRQVLGRVAWRIGKRAFEILFDEGRRAIYPTSSGQVIASLRDVALFYSSIIDEEQTLDPILKDIAALAEARKISLVNEDGQAIEADPSNWVTADWHWKILTYTEFITNVPIESLGDDSQCLADPMAAASLLHINDAVMAQFFESMDSMVSSLFHAELLVSRAEAILGKGRNTPALIADAVKSAISAMNRRAAAARHSENREMKQQVWDWCRENRRLFGSREKAAEEARRLVPVAVRTVRDWITEWDKSFELDDFNRNGDPSAST
jgi:hypothetical protein